LRPDEFEAAIARLPRWILGLAAIGTAIAGPFLGLAYAGGFLLGAIGAYFNFRLVERAVNRVARDAVGGDAKKRSNLLLIQFAGLVLGAFVIIRYSGFNLPAAFVGFLVCPAAVVLEIVYELVTYEHS
jgi:hypothetical protein